MVKISKCSLNAKKSYSTLSKGASFLGHPCMNTLFAKYKKKRISC